VADQATKENPMNKNLFEIICKAVALGMGVAVIVLNILGTLSVNTGLLLLGIGLTALALSDLEKLT
jgi:Zn-dependent membrane protease YugP